MLSSVATPVGYSSVKLRKEVVELLTELRLEITRRGTSAIQDQRTRERAALLERMGHSDVAVLALELLKDHLRPEPKLGRAKKRG